MVTPLRAGLLATAILLAPLSSACAATMDYAGAWASTTTYIVGRVVIYNKGIYYSLKNTNQAPNKGFNPSNNPTWWEQIGTIGNTLLNGVGSPTSPNLGNVGDYYIDTATNRLFGPKSSTSPYWPASGVSLVGPKGDAGPIGPQGQIGLQGTQGIKGEIGPQGPVGATGAKGDTGGTGPAGPAGASMRFGENTQYWQVRGGFFVPSPGDYPTTVDIGPSGNAMVFLYQDVYANGHPDNVCALSLRIVKDGVPELEPTLNYQTILYENTTELTSSIQFTIGGLASGPTDFYISYIGDPAPCYWHLARINVLAP